MLDTERRFNLTMAWRKGIYCQLFLVFFLISLAWCQAPPQPVAQAVDSGTSADEIALHLVVRDQQDKQVLDLKPAEIAITDNQAPVAVAKLRLVTAPPDSQRLVTLVFDQLNSAQMKSARSIAGKMLKTIPAHNFSVAVFNIDGHLRLQQAFTDDRKQIELAIKAIAPAGKGEAPNNQPEQQLIALVRGGIDSTGKQPSPAIRTLDQTLINALDDSRRMVQDQRTQPALAGLLALVRTQQKLPDRKALIYFTQSRQMDAHASEVFESVTAAANRAGVSIYVVDLEAIGLDERHRMAKVMQGDDAHDPTAVFFPGASPDNGNSGNAPGGNTGTTPGSNSTNSASSRNLGPESLAGASNDALSNSLQMGSLSKQNAKALAERDLEEQNAQLGPVADLAQHTGGSYIASDDNLRKPVERLIQDMSAYYEASYPSPIKEYDGAFRSTTIRPLRPGLRVHSMAGYYAIPPGNSSFARPFELPLIKLLSAAQWPVDLPFRASILRLGELQDSNANELVIEVPLSNVEMHQDLDTKLYTLHLSIVAEIKNADGTVVAHFSEDVSRHGALEGIETAKADFATFQRHFPASAGDYFLEAAILDCNSGKSGAQRVPFKILNPLAGPSLSDLVLIRKGEPFNAETDPLEPLRYTTYKVTPNLTGQTPRQAKNVLVFFVVHPDPEAQDAAILSMQLFKNGTPLPDVPIAPRQFNTSAPTPFLAGLPVKILPNGDYELKATLSQHGKASTSSIAFSVTGATAVNAQTAAAADEILSAPGDPSLGSSLAVTFPTTPVQPPDPEELKSLLDDATARALGYDTTLPNFICAEVTRRSLDRNSDGKWKFVDSLTELVTYRNKEELRTTLKVNNSNSNIDRDILDGVLSIGEFGGMFKGIFQPSAKTNFEWKETGLLGDGTVQIFDYHVAKQNSTFDLVSHGGEHTTVGLHGEIFIDTATHTVRRITQIADELPKNGRFRTAAFAVDYDYIAINKHDYLLPVGGQINVKLSSRAAVLNEFQFRNYRHFGSTMKILYAGGESSKEAANPPEATARPN